MRPKVLIVDDDVSTITALKRLLKPAFECEALTDSQEASKLIRDGQQFDVAMINLGMPNVDGMALLELMKQHKPNVPVVMVSGEAKPDTIITAMRRGACDFVVKPLDDAKELTQRLTDAVTQALTPKAISELLSMLENDSKPLPRYTDARQTVMTEFQKAYLTRLMREAAGNLSAASRLSGIDRANLRRALQKHAKKTGK